MYRFNLRQFSLVVLLFFSCFLQAQEAKPKVALVLSGGGAKGIAHISTLQKLDSLGIVPDLIVGTSMGSIVGGLYAMGYSGDSIASISKSVDWKELFSGKVNITDVSNEEKSEFGKYLANFEITNGKPKPILAFINDQGLKTFFSVYTFPVYNIHNFDKLPIPFRAMATDIVNGKEVILDKGSISTAMRASMSIPGVFAPVELDDVLLVDGGVLNNFPADIAKNWGADIIIGSDVGGGMQPKEKLDNITTVLFQTAMLSSNLKSPQNAKLCDVFINHVPHLTYSTGDFGRSLEIYNQGKMAVELEMDKLVELANRLKPYQQREHRLPQVPQEIHIDSIVFKGISKENLDIVKSRSQLESNKTYKVADMIDGVNRAMGTNLFDGIHFLPFDMDGKMGLKLEATERAAHQARVGLHFGTHRGAGLVLNYTGRNVIGTSSRVLLTLDLAQQPGFKAQYQKEFGKKKNWWWRTEGFGQSLEQDVYLAGELADAMKHKYLLVDTEFNKNINSLRSYIGLGVKYENNDLKPTRSTKAGGDLLGFDHYKFEAFELYAQGVFNNLNRVFYPKKGIYANMRIARPFVHDVKLNYTDPIFDDVKGRTNQYTKLSLSYEQRFKMKNKASVVLGLATGFTFISDLEGDDISYIQYGYGGKYTLGGNILSPRKDNFVFPGLNEDELIVTQFMMAKLGIQYRMLPKIYATPHVNLASVGFGHFDDYIKEAFNPSGNWEENVEISGVFSSGLTLSYNSFIGPIDFDASYVSGIGKVRVFLNIGIPLTRSN